MLFPEQPLLAISLAFLIAVGLTPVLRELAIRRHWLDQPSHRTSHDDPTPRVGGIAFIAGTVIGVGVGMPTLESWLPGVAVGALLLAFTGFLDDLRPLTVGQKFAPQVVAAGIAVVSLDPYIYLDLPFTATALHPALSRLLAMLWIVALVNAFNWLDGLDGLAGGVSLITALSIASLTEGSAIMLLAPFAAAMGGFLVWNFEPASIFMGDVGSQFAGYILAVSIFLPDTFRAGVIPVLLVFSPVLLDALVTIVRRVLLRKSPLHADQNHVFHGLARAGYSQRTISAFYYSLTAVGALVGIGYLHLPSFPKAILLIVLAGGTVYLVTRLSRMVLAPGWPNGGVPAVDDAPAAARWRANHR